MEGSAGDAHDLGDRRLGNRLLEEHPDLLFLAVELGFSQRALGTAEQAPLGPRGRQSFLGPLRDQIPLDLGEQPKQGDHHLGRHVLLSLEADRFLDRDEADLPLHQVVDDLNHLAQAAAQAGQLADDQAVPHDQRAKQLVDTPLVPALSRGGLRLDEAVDGESLLPRVVEDGQLLVGQVLGTCRNPQVGDRFHAPRYEKGESDFCFADTEHNSQRIS